MPNNIDQLYEDSKRIDAIISQKEVLDRVKQLQFWAVQYVAKIHKLHPNKIIRKNDVDSLLEFELGLRPDEDFVDLTKI